MDEKKRDMTVTGYETIVIGDKITTRKIEGTAISIEEYDEKDRKRRA